MALAAQQADLTSGGPLSLERPLTFGPAPGSERALAPPSPKPRPSPLARASLWAQLPEAEPAQPWSPSTRLALADFLRGAAHQHGALSPTQALSSVHLCRGPAPADLGYSKERQHRRPIYLNIYQRYKE